jgi:xylonate dehydratase
VIVLICGGPKGAGMQEIYQVTAALKALPHCKHVAVLTDARFSGVSTAACVGHISPEALAGGPIGQVREGDEIEIMIDRLNLVGEVNLVCDAESTFHLNEADRVLEQRIPRPDLRPHPDLPADTRLWAAMVQASGGVWSGCVYDTDAIVMELEKSFVDILIHLRKVTEPTLSNIPDTRSTHRTGSQSSRLMRTHGYG